MFSCCKPKRILSMQFSPSSIEFAGRLSQLSDEVPVTPENHKIFEDEGENTDEFEVIHQRPKIKDYITEQYEIESTTTRCTMRTDDQSDNTDAQ